MCVCVCGGGDVLKIFFLFPICIGNQMQNHKIETKSELIYEDGNI